MKIHFTFVYILVAFLLLSCVAQVATDEGEIAITTSSQEAKELFIKGRDLLEDIESYKAADLFEQAIEKDPDFALAYLYRSLSGGGYEVFRSNMAKAVELANKVSEGEKHLILFNQASADGDGAKQKAELDMLLQLKPGDKRVQMAAGRYYQNIMDDYATAQAHYNKAIALDKNYAPAYNSLGYNHMATDNYAAAEEAFKTYIKLVPDKPNPYDSYAEMLLKQGKYDASIEQYQKAYETDSKFVIALSGIGDNYIFKGDFEKAREYYQKYYDNAQNVNQKMGAFFWIATSYVHEGETDKAIKTLEEIAAQAEKENMPTSIIGSYNMAAFVLTESGHVDESEKYLEMANEVIKSANLEEKDRDSFTFNAGLNRCYYLVAKNDLDGADAEAEMCKKVAAQRQNPNEMRFLHLNFGMLENKKGNYDQAMEYYSKADQQSPYTWFCMAEAHEKMGNKEEATKLYKKIAAWNTNGVDLAVVRVRAVKKTEM